jgi:hypothetical protein
VSGRYRGGRTGVIQRSMQRGVELIGGRGPWRGGGQRRGRQLDAAYEELIFLTYMLDRVYVSMITV